MARQIELEVSPISGSFDIWHLRSIHRHIFQDVYEWAGEFRTVSISKGGHLFGLPAYIEAALNRVLAALRSEQHLEDLDRGQFALRAGRYLGEINAVHPFREGNGRVQREFIRELGLNAGFQIDWRAVTREEMTAASVRSFATGDSSALAALIEMSMK